MGKDAFAFFSLFLSFHNFEKKVQEREKNSSQETSSAPYRCYCQDEAMPESMYVYSNILTRQQTKEKKKLENMM